MQYEMILVRCVQWHAMTCNAWPCLFFCFMKASDSETDAINLVVSQLTECEASATPLASSLAIVPARPNNAYVPTPIGAHASPGARPSTHVGLRRPPSGLSFASESPPPSIESYPIESQPIDSQVWADDETDVDFAGMVDDLLGGNEDCL